jgi:hypothetical protein
MRAESIYKRLPLISIRRSQHQSDAKASRSYAALTYTTTGLELSRPLIISFQNAPARVTFPHSLLVTCSADPGAGISDSQESDAPYAADFALLDRLADDQNRILGCLGLDHRIGASNPLQRADPSRWRPLLDRRQDHLRQDGRETAIGGLHTDERVPAVHLWHLHGLTDCAMGALSHPTGRHRARPKEEGRSEHSVSPDATPDRTAFVGQRGNRGGRCRFCQQGQIATDHPKAVVLCLRHLAHLETGRRHAPARSGQSLAQEQLSQGCFLQTRPTPERLLGLYTPRSPEDSRRCHDSAFQTTAHRWAEKDQTDRGQSRQFKCECHPQCLRAKMGCGSYLQGVKKWSAFGADASHWKGGPSPPRHAFAGAGLFTPTSTLWG